ncbi:ankyrin repeat domain-containing protein [Actinoplanes couchii]|nr:ankyrin repeat domain-containing protein [Actinoplanes couchii]MDR6317971.1 ankyrin repeat protein [Actinoplanes couchii]
MAFTPIMAAVNGGDLDEVRRLLADGVNPSGGEPGTTPLHLAAKQGSLPIVELLLAAGADPLALGWSKEIPVHAATTADVARALCAASGQADGMALYQQVIHSRTEVIAVLLEYGADPNWHNVHGYTALHRATTPETARMLLAAGAVPDPANERGVTPLHDVRQPAIAAQLLAAGADPMAVDEGGRTPLHLVRDPEVMALLLDAGVPVDTPDDAGNTPLWWCLTMTVSYRNTHEIGVDAVRLLLAHGADPARRNHRGVAPVHLTHRNRSVSGEHPDEAALRDRLRPLLDVPLKVFTLVEAGRLAQYAAVVHPDGRSAVTGAAEGLIVRWSLDGDQPSPVEVVNTGEPPFHTLAGTPDGTLLALGGFANQSVHLRRWDRLDAVDHEFPLPQRSERLSFNADGSHLAAGWWSPGGGSAVAVFDVAARELLEHDALHHGANAIVFEPGGDLVVAWLGDVQTELNVIDIERFISGDYDAEVEELPLAEEYYWTDCQIDALTYAPDGKTFLASGARPEGLRWSKGEPGSVALLLAQGGKRWTLSLDAATRAAMGDFTGPLLPTSVCFTAGGTRVAVGTTGGLLLLDAATGQILEHYPQHPHIHTVHDDPHHNAVLLTTPTGLHRVRPGGNESPGER